MHLMAHSFHVIESGPLAGQTVGRMLGFMAGQTMTDAERLRALAAMRDARASSSARDQAAIDEMLKEYGHMLQQPGGDA